MYQNVQHVFYYIIIYDKLNSYFSTKTYVVGTQKDCLFVLLFYVPSQQLWSLRDGQFT